MTCLIMVVLPVIEVTGMGISIKLYVTSSERHMGAHCMFYCYYHVNVNY